MKPQPLVRLANAEDIPAITTVINAAFAVEQFFVSGRRIDSEGVREHLEKGRFLLAEHGGQLQGVVYLELKEQRAYIGLLSVDPSRQGAGVGKYLMRAAEDQARQAQCEFVDLLLVNLREDLPVFYGKLGYQRNGTAPFPDDVPTKVPCHFIIMSKPL